MQVGDRVLTVNTKGEQVFSDVVYVPHGRNDQRATFAQIATASGRDLKMTVNHYLPAGACALSTLPLVTAGMVVVGDCVQSVEGREQVVSIKRVEGKGVYTVIAMEELIVVNGIVATPFGGVNPTLANWYYNLHRLAYSFSSYSQREGTITGTDSGAGLVTPSPLSSSSSFCFFSLLDHLRILPDNLWVALMTTTRLPLPPLHQ